MSEANEVVDFAIGSIRMLDLDAAFIAANYTARVASAATRNEYYAWPDFVREALLTYSAEEI